MRDRRASVYRMAAGGSPSTEPKLPWPVDQRIAHGERLRHADQGVVDGGVAVRMVLAHHFADDFGALAGGAVGGQPHLVHANRDAPMHRLQAVADVGQRAAHDHAHGVVEVRPAHLVFDIDRDVVSVVPAAAAGRSRGTWKAGLLGRRGILRVVLIGQSWFLGGGVKLLFYQRFSRVGQGFSDSSTKLCQLPEGFSARSTTRTSTDPFATSNFKPSCPRSAVKIPEPEESDAESRLLSSKGAMVPGLSVNGSRSSGDHKTSISKRPGMPVLSATGW